MTASAFGYAKINLFLDIRSVRDNGYHNILSIMQRIDLHDTVSVSFEKEREKSITVSCDDARLPCTSDNLAYKAAAIFPIVGKIEIHIEKHIPMSAGLAGGSADAAATLISLNKLIDEPLSEEKLCALGAKLGADVPFCIKGGACIVEGIGEKMTPIASMPSFPIVVAKLGEGMSTPTAYRALDEKFDRFNSYTPKEELCQLLTVEDNKTSAPKFSQGLFNIFEAVVEPLRPDVTRLKSILKSHGAAGAMMSGSGTSVFGIFDSETKATSALTALLEAGADAHLCYPI